MFTRVLALLPLALIVSASQLKARDECPTGVAQCCNTNTAAEASKQTSDESVLALLSLLQEDTLIGTGCSGWTGVGVGNGCSANQEPVCCNDNTFNGISIGCSPINIGP